METQVMKLWKKQVEEVVKKLSEKYGFELTDALAYIEPEEKNRGRPEKKTKKVVNKTAMVEDVIQTIMGETLATETAATIAAVEVATPVVAEKKKVTRKKTAPVVVAEATPVAVEAATPVVVEAVTPVVEKKKVTKKKSPAPAEATPVVVEVATPVVVEAVKEVAPVVEKKKVTKKKEKSPAPVVAEVVAEVAPVVEKKKVTKKKETVVVEVVAPVVVEVVAPVVEKKKVTKKSEPAVKEKTPEPAEELEEEDIVEDDGPSAKEWSFEGKKYYKSCDDECDVEQCDCKGVVYDVETEDPVGTWNGEEIVAIVHEDVDYKML